MEYRRFERLVIGSAAVLVGLTLAVSAVSGGVDGAELVGQLAVVGVVTAAVHWGPKAGTLAALAAGLLYLAMRLPMLASEPSPETFLLVATRLAGYCIIGIVGGELFARVKYLFANSADPDVIDDWSRVYNQRHVVRALAQAIERHARYQEAFSIIVIALAPSMTVSRRPGELRGLVRSVANFLRDDVRMVDDVARVDDGRFVVLLPHTPEKSAQAVAERLAAGLCQTLGAKNGCVTTTCLGPGGDSVALCEFAASMAGAHNARPDQPSSGA